MDINKRWIEIFFVILVIACAFFVRMEDIQDWKAKPDRALYKGEPLLTTFDGYYYLTLARDLAQGTYRPIDEKRAVPDCPPRPEPPPLLSSIAFAVHQVTGISFNWLGAVLPAVLGLALFLPVYGIGRFYGGPLMACVSGLFSLMSFYYVYRSSLGWFDTDCMNVTFAMAAVFFAIKFGETRNKARYLWFLGAILNYLFFLWWWDQTPQVASVIALLPMAVSIVFFYRPEKKEGLIFLGGLAAAAIGVFFLKGMELPIRSVQDIVVTYKYISKEVSGAFPNIGVSISEQAIPSLKEIIVKTTDSTLAFATGIIGVLFLFYRMRTKALYLAVPIILSGLSFFFAKRFLIFLAPTLAIGIGCIVVESFYFLKRTVKNQQVRWTLVALIVAVLIYPSVNRDLNKTFWPKEPPFLVNGMVEASLKTPENSVVWAWWDHGYPMIYWAKRATINDGQVHGGERSVFNGIPYTTKNERLAANLMNFFVQRGINKGTHLVYKACGGDISKGFRLIKEVLGAGPVNAERIIASAGLKPQKDLVSVEDWLRFFFPKQARPIYLFTDWRLTVTNYWWFWLGSWDPKTHDGIHPTYIAFYNTRVGKEVITATNSNGAGLRVDVKKGLAAVGQKVVPLKALYIRYPDRLEKRTYSREKGYNMEIIKGGYSALMSENIAESVFNKLFLRHQFNKNYFSPVELKTPLFQIWKVKAETYEE